MQNIWIGNLLSLQDLPSDFDDKIIIITLISEEKILSLVKSILSANETFGSNKMVEQHIIWRIPDRPSAKFLNSNLSQLLDEMDQREIRPCLVHCAQGKSRSSALIAAWLISRKNLSLDEAMQIIRRVQPEAKPNFGFIAALKVLERSDGNVQAAIEKWSLRSETNE